MDWKLVNSNVGTWKFTILASCSYLANENPEFGPISRGNTYGHCQISTPIGSIDIDAVWADPGESGGENFVSAFTDPLSNRVAWVGSGISLEAEGIVKRYAKVEFPGTDNETSGDYNWGQSGIQPEAQGDLDVVFQDRVETYHVIINGVWEADIDVPEANQTDTKLVFQGYVGTAKEGYVGVDGNGQPSLYITWPYAHRSAFGTYGTGPSEWVNVQWTREGNSDVCTAERSATYSYQTGAKQQVAGNGAMSTRWGDTGQLFDAGGLNTWYGGQFSVTDWCGAFTVTEDSDLVNIDGTVRTAAVCGLEKKTRKIETPLFWSDETGAEYPWPSPSESYEINGQTSAIRAWSWDWVDAFGVQWPYENSYPVHYEGKLSISSDIQGFEEEFVDLPPAFGDFFDHGHRRVLGIRPTWDPNQLSEAKDHEGFYAFETAHPAGNEPLAADYSSDMLYSLQEAKSVRFHIVRADLTGSGTKSLVFRTDVDNYTLSASVEDVWTDWMDVTDHEGSPFDITYHCDDTNPWGCQIDLMQYKTQGKWCATAANEPAHPPRHPYPEPPVSADGVYGENFNCIIYRHNPQEEELVTEINIPSEAKYARFYVGDWYLHEGDSYVINCPGGNALVQEPGWTPWISCVGNGDSNITANFSGDWVYHEQYISFSGMEWKTEIPHFLNALTGARGDWYDEAGICYKADMDYLIPDALKIHLVAPGSVVGTPVTFASSSFTWTLHNCTRAVSGGRMHLTVADAVLDGYADTGDIIALGIRMTGTAYAKVYWSAPLNSEIRLHLGSHYWQLKMDAATVSSGYSLIDLLKPTSSTIEDICPQSIIPGEKPNDSTHEWEHAPGWGVGKLVSMRLELLNDDTEYVFDRIDLYRLTEAEGGFAKLIVEPNTTWNDSKTSGDFSWFDAGQGLYYTRKAILIVDGAVVWEIVSACTVYGTMWYLFKLERAIASGGIGFPLNDFSSPTEYDFNGVVSQIEIAEGDNDFIEACKLVEFLVGGTYVPSNNVISVNLAARFVGWKQHWGSQVNLPDGAHHTFRGAFYGVAFKEDGTRNSNGTIRLTTDEGVRTTQSSTGGFWISPALSTKQDVEVDGGAGDTTLLPIRSRMHTRSICPIVNLMLRYCSTTGQLIVNADGTLALRCCSAT